MMEIGRDGDEVGRKEEVECGLVGRGGLKGYLILRRSYVVILRLNGGGEGGEERGSRNRKERKDDMMDQTSRIGIRRIDQRVF